MSTSQRVRSAGTAYAIGGLLWILLAIGVTVIYGDDPPPGSAAYVVSESIFIIVQALLLFGFFGILWSGSVRGVFGKIAFGLGVLGHLTFLAGEIHSLVAGTLSDLVPLGALVSAVGILLTGIAVLVAKQWQGWTRWAPLLTGLYPWLIMFPILFLTGAPSGYAIGAWGMARLILGLAIRAQADTAPIAASPADVKLSQRSV